MKKRKPARNARRRPPAKRRNAPSGGKAAMRSASSLARLTQKETLQTAAVAVGGGALGALAAGVAVGAGVAPRTAAVMTLASGAAGAYFLRGNARVAALGAACAASGQLALAWEIQRRAEKLRAQAPAQVALPPSPDARALQPAPASGAPANAASTAAAAAKGTTPSRNGANEERAGDDEPDTWRNAWAVVPLAEDDDADDDEVEPALYAEVLEPDFVLVD